MYVRPQNHRYPGGIRLPENYSGNTFREPIKAEAEEPCDIPESNLAADSEEDTEKAPAEAAALLTSEPTAPAHKKLSLFGKGGSSNEELLILALILLLSDSDKNDDIILFLMLLLFIK